MVITGSTFGNNTVLKKKEFKISPSRTLRQQSLKNSNDREQEDFEDYSKQDSETTIFQVVLIIVVVEEDVEKKKLLDDCNWVVSSSSRSSSSHLTLTSSSYIPNIPKIPDNA